jgi:hypothetical protein
MKANFLYQLIGAFGSHRAEPRFAAEPFINTTSGDEVEEVLARLKRPRALSCPIYTRDDRDSVWHKGKPVLGWDPSDWRVDHDGNALFREAYGDSTSAFGWEIGHIVAPSEGGLEVLSNWRPQLIQDTGLGRAAVRSVLEPEADGE